MAEKIYARRRGRSWFVGLVLLASGAAGAYEAGRWTAAFVQDRTLERVQVALAGAGADWVTAAVDGLTLRLSGKAPDEVQHIRAIANATAAAGIARIDDRIEVPRAPETAPPPFRLEVLRSEHGTSVIGLAPLDMDRPAVIDRLEHAAGQGKLTDLLEHADHPPPEGWDAAVTFALSAAEQMPRAKIVVTPGRIQIDAVTDGVGEKARLEQALAAAVPPGITLVTDITAPRPVIAPFVLELVRTPEGTQLDRCAADSDAARDRILAAAAKAGADAAECPVGLGAPSPQWADAALAGIAALDALPQGRLTISDARVTLQAPHEVPQADFDAARDRLAAALPRTFSLEATLDPAPVAEDDSPLRFVASATGLGVQLRGAIADQRMGEAVASFAAARFGPVDSGLTLREDTPPGWTARVLAALEAIDALERGSAMVTPELIRLNGTTGSPTAAQEIADRLGARLDAGAVYELALTYDPRLDPAVDLPSGADCVDALNTTMQQAEIGFEPNLAVIAGDVAPVVEELAATMARCGDFRIEIGGHTDSRGSDSFNRDLSAARAQAVLDAMAAGGIDTTNLVATGYGESRPVGPNDTEAEREANRRIEFRLLSPNPVDLVPSAATITRGVTGGPTPAAQVQPSSEASQIGPRNQVDGDGAEGTDDTEGAAPPADTTEPEAETETEAEAEAETVPDPTPDEIAKAEGISIRPDRITVEGNRLTTPVPPPLLQSRVPEPEAGVSDPARRPRARPEE